MIGVLIARLFLATMSAWAAEPGTNDLDAMLQKGCVNPITAYRPEKPEAWAHDSASSADIAGNIIFDRDKLTFTGSVEANVFLAGRTYVEAVAPLRFIGNIDVAEPPIHGEDAIPPTCVALYAFDPPFATRLRGLSLCGGLHDQNPPPAVYLLAHQPGDGLSTLYLETYGEQPDFAHIGSDDWRFRCAGFRYSADEKSSMAPAQAPKLPEPLSGPNGQH